MCNTTTCCCDKTLQEFELEKFYSPKPIYKAFNSELIINSSESLKLPLAENCVLSSSGCGNNYSIETVEDYAVSLTKFFLVYWIVIPNQIKVVGIAQGTKSLYDKIIEAISQIKPKEEKFSSEF